MNHSFTRKFKYLSYTYCCRCGLIALSNLATRKEINKKCNGRFEKE